MHSMSSPKGGPCARAVSRRNFRLTLQWSKSRRRRFVLDHTGRIMGQEFVGQTGHGGDFRLGPLLSTQSARWDHRPYYWKAVANMGTAVFCQPYLSLTSGRASVGVTMAVLRDGQVMVVGSELDWTSPHLAWPAGE